MKPSFAEILTFVRQITRRREWPLVTFIVLGAVTLTWLLRYDTDPRPVRVPGASMALKLNCIPATAEVQLRRMFAGNPIAGAQYFNSDGTQHGPRIDYEVTRGSNTDHTAILLAAPQKTRPLHFLPPTNGWAVLELHFARTTSIDVLQVAGGEMAKPDSCAFRPLREKELVAALPSQESKVLHYRFMQEVVSDTVLSLKEAVGNYLLAAM